MTRRPKERTGGRTWVALASVALPRKRVAHGLARAATAGRDDAEVAALLDGKGSQRVSLPAAVPKDIVKLWRSSLVDDVVVARFQIPIRTQSGAAARQPGQDSVERLLDGRQGPASVEFGVGETIFRIALNRGELHVARLGGPDPATESPPIASWLSGWPAPSWLKRVTTAHASSVSMSARLAAGGLVLRHWTDRNKGQSFQLMLEGNWPGEAVRAWFGGLQVARQRAAAMEIVQAAKVLRDELTELEGLRARGAAGAKQVLLAWLHRRDDLECAASCWSKRPRAVSAALESLDELAFVNAALFDGYQFSDARLQAVADAMLEDWWGQFA